MADQISTPIDGQPGCIRLSARQFEVMAEEVASRTRTLQQLLMIAQEEDDAHQRAVFLDAAVSIATSIGAMADGALGGSIIGDADHWNFGPNFADRGKAVQA